MNEFQAAGVRRQVIRALRRVGAEHAKVMRKERDRNGMPTGESIEVGTVYGVCYQQMSQGHGTPQIAVPGVTVQGWPRPRYVGVVIQGEPPKRGDCLYGREGKKILLETRTEAGIVYGIIEE